MNAESNSKVQARHLSRNAHLYVRQSTPRQVFENVESTKRQYALKQRAIALGWRIEQVVIIDADTASNVGAGPPAPRAEVIGVAPGPGFWRAAPGHWERR